jgi:D-tyrosyl-tRNA(Tyr) deacylase
MAGAEVLPLMALIQRVSAAHVVVGGSTVGAIGRGLLLLVCAEPTDTSTQVCRLVEKVIRLRIFSDAAGRMNLSLQDVAGGLLVVSQFTLAAQTDGGNRPSFAAAAPAAQARVLYDEILRLARERHPEVQAGVFGADMQLHLVNDGPVTIPMRM